MSATRIGLRIDVDTWRGTRVGVPALREALAKSDVRGTFFFSVVPDNMGRHIWRLLKPAFLKKILRSNAPGLYGWDILLRGTFWPGPLIGKGLSSQIRQVAQDGHEIGVHAWDHHAWQAKIDGAPRALIHEWMRRAADCLLQITGAAPTCAATPGWRTTEAVMLDRTTFPFRFNSDCRGDSIFPPVVDGKTLETPQIPATIPTYDEIIGQNGITAENYNQYILDQVRPGELNVLTIHAEVEGIVCLAMFREFLKLAKARNFELVPLGELLVPAQTWPIGQIVQEEIPGREGWVAVQAAV